MRIAAQINKLLNLDAAHAFYFKTGNWYHVLKRFPGMLIDSDGYVRFETEITIRPKE